MKCENVGIPKGVMENLKPSGNPYADNDKGNGANNAQKKAKSIKPFKR